MTRSPLSNGTKSPLQTARIHVASPCPNLPWTRAWTRSITPRATVKIFPSSYAPSHRSVNLASDSRQSKIASFPLDRAGRFAGDVEDHAVDALDFVADAVGNAREQFVGDAHPVCSHAVLTFHDPQGDRVFVRSLVAHNADRLYWEQHRKRLPDFVIPIGGFHFALHNRICLAEDRQSLGRDFAQ